MTSCFWAPTVHEARQVEKKAHEILKEEEKYLLGEWFDKKPEEAAEIVQFAASVLGVELTEKIENAEVVEWVRNYMDGSASKYRKFQNAVGVLPCRWKEMDDESFRLFQKGYT